MGFEQGGEAGARLGKKLSYPGSPDTILRLVKRAELPTASAPRVVGLDDWSWKRRRRYGTLICDLESRKPLDVLADRSVETVSAWFETHPSVEIVSRDRSSEYAAAIKKGAPQAIEVADRWHLGKNLTESVQTLLARCRAEIRHALQAATMPAGYQRAETEAVLEEARESGDGKPNGEVVHLDDWRGSLVGEVGVAVPELQRAQLLRVGHFASLLFGCHVLDCV